MRELNRAQLAAVERWGQDVCVVAGPGSGKTRVLIERFRWLVGSKGIHPQRILTVTFTDKAATEIKKRLIDTFGESGEIREAMERAWVSTLHGFCQRLLKENAIAAGIDPDFELMEEGQAPIIARQQAELALDALLRSDTGLMRLMLAELDTGGADVAEGLVALYEEARTAGVPLESLCAPEQLAVDVWQPVLGAARQILTAAPEGTPNQREAHRAAHGWARDVLTLPADADWTARVLLLDECPRPASLSQKSRARAALQELKDALIPAAHAQIVFAERRHLYPLFQTALANLHRGYARWKRERSLLDFNDLEELAIRLLETDAALRARVQNQFDQVLMDELQDTNRLQWRLIDLVRRPNGLFAVGDINQSIYYFRHADPGVFRRYRDSLLEGGGVVDELRENYRSRTEILDAVNLTIPHLADGVEPHRLTARREFPAPAGPCIEFVHTFAGQEGDEPAETEALWIAGRIRELAEATPLSKIAVLARTIGALGPIQNALDQAGVPSVITGGRSFYESREVRDLVAWIATAANPLDEISLATVLRSPLVGISDEVLLRLRVAGPSLIEAIAASEDARLVWFRTLLDRHRKLAGEVPIDRLLTEAIDQSDYESGLSARARANIARLLTILRRHPSARFGELADRLALWRAAESEPEAPADEVSQCVRLMSVHAAKGLEFPVVVLAAMRAAGQNRKPMFCFDGGGRIGVCWRHPRAAKSIPDPVHLAVYADKKRQEDGEEDRLLYVAMTRAEERLICSASTGGTGSWAKRVSEGLGLPTGNPKQARQEEVALRTGAMVRLLHTSECPVSDLPKLASASEEAVDFIDPPSRLGQHETTVPVTSVAQFAFCPRQYYLARYLNWPNGAQPSTPPDEEDRPDTGEWSASEFGTMVHALLSGESVEHVPAEALEMKRAFDSSVLGRRAATAVRAGREFDFLIEMEGVILRGQVDLWFEQGGELILVDYKSDHVEPGGEFRHAYRYMPQLRLYALALEKVAGRVPDRAFVWYLRTAQAVNVALGNAHLERARDDVRRLKEAQAGMNFPLREGEHCRKCAYYANACPAVIAEESLTAGAGVAEE